MALLCAAGSGGLPERMGERGMRDECGAKRGPARTGAECFRGGIADTGHQAGSEGGNRIRVVAESTGSFYGRPMTAGEFYTVAGDGSRGFSGDGGPATRAALSDPSGVAADATGNLLIATPETGGSGWWPADAGDGAVPGPPDLAYRAVPAPPGSRRGIPQRRTVAHLCLPRRAG